MPCKWPLSLPLPFLLVSFSCLPSTTVCFAFVLEMHGNVTIIYSCQVLTLSSNTLLTYHTCTTGNYIVWPVVLYSYQERHMLLKYIHDWPVSVIACFVSYQLMSWFSFGVEITSLSRSVLFIWVCCDQLLVLCFGILMGLRTRNIPAKFNESGQVRFDFL